MTFRKVRGHRRLHKQIDKWVAVNKSIDVLPILERGEGRHYTKISIHPWNSLSFTRSSIPQPRRLTKRKILKGLLDIYHAWKLRLDETNKPYYLKIWLFEPRFNRSQVVCAVGDSANFYKNTFSKCHDGTIMKIGNDMSAIELNSLTWECCRDIEYHGDGSERDYGFVWIGG